MAILQPFECTVEVDGVALQEYEDEDTEQANTTTSLTKYIEAASGANFRLKFTLQPGWTMKADHIVWYLNVDGIDYGGNMISNESYGGCRRCSSVQSGAISGAGDNWTVRKFTFADIIVGEGPGDLEPEEVKVKFRRLGQVSVEIWRVRLLRQKNHSDEVRHDPPGVVPEKALKGQALSLSTDLRPVERMAAPRMIAVAEKIEPYPVASFHFKYRSRESLKQLLIVPRSPSPTPLEERGPRVRDLAEALELNRRQRAQIAEAHAVKNEGKSFKKRDRSSTVGQARPTKLVRKASGHYDLDLEDSTDDVVIVKVESRPAQKSRPPAEAVVIDLLD